MATKVIDGDGADLVNDSSPQLGGDLDLNSFTITDWNTLLELAKITGATYKTAQEIFDVFHSAGFVAGGDITDDTDGTITVAAGQGFIRATDSEVAQLLTFDWAEEAGTNVDLVDDDMNYIYVEYNAGSPRVIVTTTKRSDHNTNVFLGTVYRDGTSLHVTPGTRIRVGDHAAHMVLRMVEVAPFSHVSGAGITEAGTRNIVAAAGVWWEGLDRFTTSEVDTSAAGDFIYYYRDGVGGWTKVAAQTQINNTQYDDGDGGLGSLTGSKYGVHWIYLGQDNDIYVVYGRGDYTLTQAQDADVPGDTPPHFAENHVRLLGKVIIQKDAASFTSIESAFDVAFTAGVPSQTFASIAETNTGTESAKGVTPDGLSGSYAGTKTVQVIPVNFTTDMTTGDGKHYIHIPAELAGMNLVAVHAKVITAGVTGTCDIQIANVTQAVDMLSTKLTIDTTETGSEDAATPAVIDAANDDVAENDQLRIDIDAIHSGTAAKGLLVTLSFRLP